MTELDREEWGEEPPELVDLYDEMTLRRLGLGSELEDGVDGWQWVEPDPVGPATPGDVADGDAVGDPGTTGDGDAMAGTDPDRAGDVAAEAIVADGTAEAEADGSSARWRRARPMGLAGAMVAGAMLGLGDVLEPEKRRDAIVEPELLGEPELEQPVQFVMVPGLPRASVVILRPWLRRPRPGPGWPDEDVEIGS